MGRFVVKGNRVLRIGLACERQRQVTRHDTFGSKSRVYVDHFPQAAGQQPGAGQQHDSERRFEDHKSMENSNRALVTSDQRLAADAIQDRAAPFAH